MEHTKAGVLQVVEEIDHLLTAMRILTRTSERQRLHAQTHALEFSVELLLRRRNYILNVSLVVGTNQPPPYDLFPCENCHITYPSVFIMSWLEHILKSASIDYTSLCSRSCSQIFGEPVRSDQVYEGALYPMGSPFVAGPFRGPPRLGDALSELDEVELVCRCLGLVVTTLRTTAFTECPADTKLAESAYDLLNSRRNFGFDMDCVQDPQVNQCKLQLMKVLDSYAYCAANETLEKYTK